MHIVFTLYICSRITYLPCIRKEQQPACAQAVYPDIRDIQSLFRYPEYYMCFTEEPGVWLRKPRRPAMKRKTIFIF